MAVNSTYNVIISDKAKRMLGMHIRFMAQVNKRAAAAKKKEIMDAMKSLKRMPERFPFCEEPGITPNKYHKMFIPKWYLVLFRFRTIRSTWNMFLIAEQNIAGCLINNRI